MTIADTCKQLAYDIRAIPGQFGIRPYTVAVINSTLAGTAGLTGTITGVTTAITEANGQPPKVRFLDDEERALSDVGKGTIEVGPITPNNSAGTGTLLSALNNSSGAELSHLHFLVTGPEFPNGRRFRLVGQKTDRAIHFKVTLTPVSD